MTIDIALVTSAIGVLIPLLNALVSHVDAKGAVKSGVAVVIAALGSIATWATGVVGNVSLKQLAVVAIGALFAAGGSRISWLSNVEALVWAAVPKGIGNPAKALAQDPVQPVVVKAATS
jgi:hypothetical protein